MREAERTMVFPIKNTEVVMVGEVNGGTDWSVLLYDVDIVIHLAARVHVMNDT